MANAYNLRYFTFRDEEDGFQVSQGPPPRKKEERERCDLKNGLHDKGRAHIGHRGIGRKWKT
jgi:hypothetical protein